MSFAGGAGARFAEESEIVRVCAPDGRSGDGCTGCVVVDTARKGTRLNVDVLRAATGEDVEEEGEGGRSDCGARAGDSDGKGVLDVAAGGDESVMGGAGGLVCNVERGGSGGDTLARSQGAGSVLPLPLPFMDDIDPACLLPGGGDVAGLGGIEPFEGTALSRARALPLGLETGKTG